ncbi:hypothetical protein ACWEN6_39870 [Sphaerisporangium sp. NPDC004334]
MLLVGVYLVLNAVVVAVAIVHVLERPSLVVDWERVLSVQYSSPVAMIALAALAMPKLALGMSGFETGVAVMPLVKGDLAGRVRGTKRLLTVAAAIMSVFLILSSFATTVLIPEREFESGGKASGRALAYLAHRFLGNWFGSLYDVSTIAILWFAGASALAGLLNLVPRYLPRYGMAPDWTRATRPLVLVFTAIAFAITFIFDADVDAQGGAYATGVLVLFMSANVAVALAARRHGQRGLMYGFVAIGVVLAYTLVANVIERPDGVKIASFFIVAIIVTSLVSRATRSTELRVSEVRLDAQADRFVRDACGEIHLIANEPHRRDQDEYHDKLRETWLNHRLHSRDPIIFVEVTVPDASEFETELRVTGEERYGHRILRVESSTVPNALAALMLYLRDRTGRVPHVYFHWAEGNPITAMLRYLVLAGATSRRSPARCCARPSRRWSAARTSTSAERGRVTVLAGRTAGTEQSRTERVDQGRSSGSRQ